MAIDPTKSSGANPLSGARIDQTSGNQSARQPAQLRTTPAKDVDGDGDAQSDRVQLSSEAREAGQATSATSASGLSKDRLHEILKRLTSGYYDNPQVIDRVARKVNDELRGSSAAD
jgi:hypothetical protein